MIVNGTVTIVAGTAQRLSLISRPATRINIQQPPAAGGGAIYVFRGVPGGTTPTTGTFPYTTLAPPSATVPGGLFADQTDTGDESSFDLTQIWVDGSHTGDAVNFSYNLKN